ncbi:hypothetical protein PIB30_049876 [Stylosanthes scabra]|uniref:Histone H2A n=1 Tax=Stylosanthes scabra TaxID=79078 RepID=A0ABU6VJF9_9FABA|nr:hypothetical protein [Stylosanthes scabra]
MDEATTTITTATTTTTTTFKAASGRREHQMKKVISKSTKAGIQFIVDHIARYMKNICYSKRLDTGAPIYLAAVVEYLAAEVTMEPSTIWDLFGASGLPHIH